MANQTSEAQVKEKSMSDLETMRHSAAHVMAEAVLSLFPEGKLGIGPPIEDGFYYDFDLPRPLTPEDLATIEAKMREIVKRDIPFDYSTLPPEEAAKQFAEAGQPYKVELIGDLQAAGETKVGVFRQGDFVDLCRGPHVPSTRRIGHFKLLSVAGAYWRGDEKRPMLQRIYGTTFPTKDELFQYLQRIEEAQRRDHRKLGRELDLFSVNEDVGAGLITWHPKGGRLRTLVEDFWREQHYKNGYDIVYSPHIGKAALWETSGHLDFYRESMFAPMNVDGQEYFAKPMNCPFHIQIYKSQMRSYRDLPLRWAELGTVYRYERAGVLHGLLRVRGFTQDDAHIFCRPDQMESEIIRCLDFTMALFHAFGFYEMQFNLSTRPEKSVGEQERWDAATAALRQAMEQRGIDYVVDEGGGAFYGPKIDIKLKDAIGRLWQCTTIQFDFNLPERFDMTYIGDDGKEHRPYVVHRALLGSLERFLGMLIEQYAGAFPVWLAPVQAIVLPIADRHAEYCQSVVDTLRQANLRVELDDRREKVNYKIREAQLQKIPYMLVVGDKEIETGAVAVRLRTGENLGAIPVADFTALANKMASTKSLGLTE